MPDLVKYKTEDLVPLSKKVASGIIAFTDVNSNVPVVAACAANQDANSIGAATGALATSNPALAAGMASESTAGGGSPESAIASNPVIPDPELTEVADQLKSSGVKVQEPQGSMSAASATPAPAVPEKSGQDQGQEGIGR